MAELNLNILTTFKTTDCITCGVVIALTSELYDQRQQNGKNFYCPNGHGQHFVIGETEEDKLRKQLAMEEDSNVFLRMQNEKERNRTRAQKAAKTRLKNRIKNGVCPCCNKTVKQLASHMKSKHPGYIINY